MWIVFDFAAVPHKLYSTAVPVLVKTQSDHRLSVPPACDRNHQTRPARAPITYRPSLRLSGASKIPSTPGVTNHLWLRNSVMERRRPPPPLEGEILGPADTPRIKVEVVHRAYQPRRQRNAIPPWLVALLIIAVLIWISPFGAVVAIVMGAVL